jgi:hypothetical protein
VLTAIRHSIFSKILWGLLGLHLLNVSVDVTDPFSNSVAEDLSINDQESIVELIVEKLFGFEDAIAEYDDHDTEEQNKKSTVKIDLVMQNLSAALFGLFVEEQTIKPLFDYHDFLSQGAERRHFPPPKFTLFF